MTTHFNVVVIVFHLAHGGSWFHTTIAAGVVLETVKQYTMAVCEGIVEVMKPQYMRKPTPEELVEPCKKRFEDRRGIANVCVWGGGCKQQASEGKVRVFLGLP